MGGGIDEQSAPQIQDYTFLRSYVVDPTDNHQIEVQSAELDPTTCGADADPANCRVILGLKNYATNPNVTLFLPLNETKNKLYFEYLKNSAAVKFTYNKDTNDAAAKLEYEGPKYAEKNNDTGKAEGRVIVSTARNYRPTLNSNNGAEISHTDISTADRTIYRFTVKTGNNTQLTYGAEKKGPLHITATDDQAGYDWQMGDGQNFKFKDTKYVMNSNDSSLLQSSPYHYDDGQTVKFKIYHDRVMNGNPDQYQSYSSVLANVWLNNQPFTAPQPLGRFGVDKYKGVVGYESLSTPWYNYHKGQIGNNMENKRVVTAFTNEEGWNNDLPINQGLLRNPMQGRVNALVWWINMIAGRVIGKQTVTHVKTGPLAGATVTIKIIDALPSWFNRNLGEYSHPDDLPSNIPNNECTESTNGRIHGYCNSLRLAYEVTIQNPPDNINLQTEWARTNNSKTGLYLNQGVEDMQVYAVKVGYGRNPNEDRLDWRPTAGTAGVIDGAFLPKSSGGLLEKSSWVSTGNSGENGWPQNDNPIFKVRGNVQNGYIDPQYVNGGYSTEVAQLEQEGKYAKDPALSKNVDGYGFEGAYPLYAYGSTQALSSTDYGNLSPAKMPRVFFGGMNTVGIHADLFSFPVTYDLNGGKVNKTDLFPTDPASADKYDVEGNPIVHLPLEMPRKNGQPFLYWELHRINDNNDTLVGKFMPGQDIDVRDTNDIGGRISDKAGVKQLDRLVLKAVYPDESNQSAGIFKIQRQFLNGSNESEKTEVLETFNGISGVYASLSKNWQDTYYPATITLCDGNVVSTGATCNSDAKYYKRTTNVADINKSLLNAGNNVAFNVKYTPYTPKLADTFNPQTEPITVNRGETPSAEALKNAIKGTINGQQNQPLPADATVSMTHPGSFNPNKIGDQEVPVTIHYPDGSEGTATITIHVNDNRNDAQKWQEEQNDNKNISAVEKSFEYGAAVPEDLGKQLVAEAGKLPEGAKFSVAPAVNTKPATEADHTQNVTVTVTFPDGSTLQTTAKVTIDNLSGKYSPKASDTALNVKHGTDLSAPAGDDLAKKAVKDADTLPEGTKFEFVGTPDTSKAGAINPKPEVKITYPDGTSTTVPVDVNVLSDADVWLKDSHAGKPLEGVDQSFDWGHALSDADKKGFVKDAASLPEGVTVSLEPDPDMSPKSADKEQQDVVAVVSFTDGSQLKVSAKMTIKPLADTFKPQAANVSSNYGKPLDENALKAAITGTVGGNENQPLPEGTTVKVVEPNNFDPKKSGKQTVQVEVTYPDGSKGTVSVDVTVGKSDAQQWKESKNDNKNISAVEKSFEYGAAVPEDLGKQLVAEAGKLPEGAKFSVAPAVNTKPATEADHTQNVTVTVTFPDGSTLQTTAKVTIDNLSGKYSPKASDTALNVKHGTDLSAPAGDDLAKKAVKDADTLPEGTKFEFVGTPDTSKAGTIHQKVKVTFPDGSSKVVDTTIKVMSDAEKWEADNNLSGITGKNQKFTWGQEITDGDVRKFAAEADKLPEGATVIVAPAVNTKPTKQNVPQNLTVTVAFPDGSTLKTQATATVGTAAEAFEVSSIPFDVQLNEQPTETQLKNAVTDTHGKQLPEGTKVELVAPLDSSSLGEKPVQLKVTFPDGSTEVIDLKINIVDNRQSTKFEPEVKPVDVPYGGTVPPVTSSIANAKDFPEGTKFEPAPCKVDTTKAGKYVCDVKVVYPDGTHDIAQVPVNVATAADTFKPTASETIPVLDYNAKLGDDLAKQLVEDADKLPEGTKFVITNRPNTAISGLQEVDVQITYPDGSTTTIKSSIVVRDEVRTWLHETGQQDGINGKNITPTKDLQFKTIAQKFVWGHKISNKDLVGLVANADKLPEGAKVSVAPAINTTPATDGLHQKVVVTITFPDGSVISAPVDITIGDQPSVPVVPVNPDNAGSQPNNKPAEPTKPAEPAKPAESAESAEPNNNLASSVANAQNNAAQNNDGKQKEHHAHVKTAESAGFLSNTGADVMAIFVVVGFSTLAGLAIIRRVRPRSPRHK